MLVPAQQVVAGHQLTGDTEAALHSALLQERVLERVQRVALGQAFDCRDVATVRFDPENQARVDDLAVKSNGARAALADQAALLRAGQANVVAQHIEKCVVRRDRDLSTLAVERQANLHHGLLPVHDR